jgi:hypothetical protein
MSKSFLAVGDYLINPDLLAYAILENEGEESRLRLGFAANFPGARAQLLLVGEEAKEVLRWLRLNATFLTRGGGFGSLGRPEAPAIESESRGLAQMAHTNIGQGWGLRGASQQEETTSFLSRSRDPF